MAAAGLEATGKLAVAGTAAYAALTLDVVDRLTRGASTQHLQRLAARTLTTKDGAGAFARALLLLDQLAKKHPIEAVGGASLIPIVAAELGFGVASPIVALAYLTFIADAGVFCSAPSWKFGDDPGDFFKFGDVKYPDPEAKSAQEKV